MKEKEFEFKGESILEPIYEGLLRYLNIVEFIKKAREKYEK